MMPLKDQSDLCQLVLKFKSQTITTDELNQLDEALQEPENMHLFVEQIHLYTQLNQLDNLGTSASDDAVLNETLWQQMAQHEKSAEEVFVPPAKPQRAPKELIEKVVYPKRNRTINKTSLAAGIISIAAVLFLVLFLRFPPDFNSSIEVAVLSDSLNAKWQGEYAGLESGDELFTSYEPLTLQDGHAELLFNNNTRITVEAPAEFQITDRDVIHLSYGKLFAQVPQEAIGFSINTPTARVIDLGTEFGVEADVRGDTHLHVVKGKTVLIAGSKQSKVSIEVNADVAKKVSAATRQVSDVPFDGHRFTRKINSQHKMIWKGQSELNLADIVGGGTGFGSGRIGKGVSPADGKTHFVYTGQGHIAPYGYTEVAEYDFIDGVFVPNARNGAVQITSQGHVFKDCPDTTGKYFDAIRNGGMIQTANQQQRPMNLNGLTYGTVENPAIYLHSNAGITFDLQAMRKALPQGTFNAFHSLCGIASNIESASAPGADIFVLVDGHLKKSASLTIDSNSQVDIQIPLSQTDRFLTLVTTDGGNTIASDWVMFTRPYLLLNPAD